MSKRNGDRARFNREQKKRMLRRTRSRELRKTWEDKAPGVETPPLAEGGNQIIASRLRQLPGEHQADLAALEIVVYQVPQGERND